jgi:threonylcarbamoyladenosine tRNA methylthiotransferase CDKAL1
LQFTKFLNLLSDRVVEVVEETLKGHSVRLLGQKKENGKRLAGPSLLLPKIRKNPLIEVILITIWLFFLINF